MKFLWQQEMVKSSHDFEHELSYRKQDCGASAVLCTQYVKGVSSDPVTLKSRLRVTQDHWKRNH